MKVSLHRQINHDLHGFCDLIELYAQIVSSSSISIEVDMANVSWFDADMCAVLGALLHKSGVNIRFVNITNDVAIIMRKNGFLSDYGHDKIHDRWGTVVEYKKFKLDKSTNYILYVEKELLCKHKLYHMRESIFEIFNNSLSHSQCPPVTFSCGQLFPRTDMMSFTVADLGIGIYENVRKFRKEKANKDTSPPEALAWAVKKRKTTRGSLGGHGLTELCHFVDENNGTLQIVSDKGYLCWREKEITNSLELPCRFPGTVVSLRVDVSGIL